MGVANIVIPADVKACVRAAFEEHGRVFDVAALEQEERILKASEERMVVREARVRALEERALKAMNAERSRQQAAALKERNRQQAALATVGEEKLEARVLAHEQQCAALGSQRNTASDVGASVGSSGVGASQREAEGGVLSVGASQQACTSPTDSAVLVSPSTVPSVVPPSMAGIGVGSGTLGTMTMLDSVI